MQAIWASVSTNHREWLTTGYYPMSIFFIFLRYRVDIYLEIFEYIGTILVVGSMLMTSVAKLRIVNICVSTISAIYSSSSTHTPFLL